MLRSRLAVLTLALTLCAGSSLAHAQETPPLLRGDVDLSGAHELTDSVRILSFLFQAGSAPPCEEIADTNSDGNLDLSDGVFLLTFLFLGGEAPEPFSPLEQRLCTPVDDETFDRGMAVFLTKDAMGNEFACGSCHAMMPTEEENPRRPGHPLLDALHRPSYKNGLVDTFLEAANVCRVEWMFTTEWSEEDADFLDMVGFMDRLAPEGPGQEIEIEIEPSSIEGPSTGDAARGCEVFHATCVGCHGESAGGTLLAPSLVFNPNEGLDPDYIRRRVRTSGNPDSIYGEGLTGGVMPFWSADRLSSDELEDIVAWLTTRPVPECGDEPPPLGNVTRSGTFTTRFHDVSGTVEEFDSGHIRLSDFVYDGQGIQVYTWLYRDGDILNGYQIGSTLLRAFPGWEGETIVMPIPENLTPDMYDAVSVWCVPARANFGEALLSPVQ